MKTLFFVLMLLTLNLQAAQDYIVVIASVKVKPGAEEKFKEAANQVVAPTLQEKGAIMYEFNQSQEDATEFTTYERWSAKENLDAHLQTPHMAKFFEIVGPLFERAPIIKTFKSINTDPCVNSMKKFIQKKNDFLIHSNVDDDSATYTGKYSYKKITDSVYEYSFEMNIYDIGNETRTSQIWKHQFAVGANSTCKEIK